MSRWKKIRLWLARLLVRGTGYGVLDQDKVELLLIGELEYLRNFVQSVDGVRRVRIAKRKIRWQIERMIERSAKIIIGRAA